MILIFLVGVWLIVYLLARWLNRRGRPDWRQDVLAAGLLGLACVGYFWRVLLGGASMPADGGDLVSFLWPAYRFAAESLRSGQLPLWNPHLYGGAPHVADIQAGFLYPANLLLFLLVPNFGVKAMEGLSILHLWWAGLGMYAFLRSLRWGVDQDDQIVRPAALGAALAFAFADAFWIHFGNLNYIAVASWLPWVMACFARALEGRKPRDKETGSHPGEISIDDQEQTLSGTVNGSQFTPLRFAPGLRAHWSPGWSAAGGLLLGIATLAGHIQATIFIGIAVVLYGLFWLYGEARQKQDSSTHSSLITHHSSFRYDLTHLLLSTLTLALIAFLVAAPVLLPVLQLTRYVVRADWTYADTVGYSLAPAQWIGLLVPGFFGRGPQLQWGLWPRVEAGYLGILPLVLAALAVLARRERRTWTLLGLSGVAFLLALGVYSIPQGWLSLVPGFNLLRAPARFMLLVDFGLAALAGLGLHVLLGSIADSETWKGLARLSDGLGWVSKAVLAVVVPLTFAAVLLAQDKDPTVYVRVSVAAVAILVFVAFLLASWGLVAVRKAGWASPSTLGALAVLLIFLDLASTGAYVDLGGENPAKGFDHPQIAEFLAQDNEPFRIDPRTGIDQLWQPDTALLYGLDDAWGIVNPSMLAAYQRYWDGTGSRSSRLYDFLNARYVIAAKDVTLDWDKFELAFDGDPGLNVYRNRTALPRAQIIHDAQVVEGDNQAWEAVQAAGFDPSKQVVVEPAGAQTPTPGPAAGPEQVRWLERGNNELALEVTATAPGYLVLSEVWYPGWQAEVEVGGQVQRQPVLRANSAFRAIPLWQAGTYQVRLRFTPTAWRVGVVLSATTLVLLAIWGLVALLNRRKHRTHEKVEIVAVNGRTEHPIQRIIRRSSVEEMFSHYRGRLIFHEDPDAPIAGESTLDLKGVPARSLGTNQHLI